MTGPEEDAIIGQRFVTPDLNRSEVAAALKTIEEKFNLHWLTDNSAYHPIRDLWSRADFIALQELFSLGNSIQLIEAVDASWIADAIKQAKSFERNNRAGYILEIMAIAAMMRGGVGIRSASYAADQRRREFHRLRTLIDPKPQMKATLLPDAAAKSY